MVTSWPLVSAQTKHCTACFPVFFILVLSSYLGLIDFLELFSFKLHFVNLRINENDDDDDDYDNNDDDDDKLLTGWNVDDDDKMGLKATSVGEHDPVEGIGTSLDQLNPPVVDNKLTTPGPVHVGAAAT